MRTVPSPRPLECSKICTLLTLRYTNRYCQFILIFVFVGMKLLYLSTDKCSEEKTSLYINLFSIFASFYEFDIAFWNCSDDVITDIFLFLFCYSPMSDSQYDQIDLNNHLHFSEKETVFTYLQ
jgi:hypothetical protein